MGQGFNIIFGKSEGQFLHYTQKGNQIMDGGEDHCTQNFDDAYHFNGFFARTINYTEVCKNPGKIKSEGGGIFKQLNTRQLQDLLDKVGSMNHLEQ